LDKSKHLKRATTISSSSGIKKDLSKLAKNIIRDNAGVGTDLRPPPPIPVTAKVGSLGTSFLKPSGVDAPAIGAAHERDSDDLDGIVPGARAKTKKRERVESRPGSAEGEMKKRKKKRKSVD
jgi:hypothetical protein